MTSLLVPERSGVQAPRFCTAPERASSAAPEAIDLATTCRVTLDQWQKNDLAVALGERQDGLWAASAVALLNQRQNGKGVELMVVQLLKLYLLKERLQTHTAHRLDTCLEHFIRVVEVVEGTPDLLRRTKKITRTNGAEAIELTTGERLLFKARSKEAGRGFSGSTIYLDEALYLFQSTVGGMVPTMSAQPNTQLFYSSSMPKDGPEGEVLRRLIARGRKGSSSRLAYIEYSAEPPPPSDPKNPDSPPTRDPDVLAEVARDRERWYHANPSMGVVRPDGSGLTEEYTETELDEMELEEFLRERLGIIWLPEDAEEPEHVLGRDAWKAGLDPDMPRSDTPRFALDVSVGRDKACFATAGKITAGTSVEITADPNDTLDYRPGTDWVPTRAKALQDRWGGPLFAAEKSPASFLKDDLEAAGVDVRWVTVEEHQAACAHLVDETAGGRVRHLGQPALDGAIKAAAKSFRGDAFLWSRRTSTGDICPLVAVTIAAWATTQADPSSVYEERGMVAL